jgi:hypothetical protein
VETHYVLKITRRLDFHELPLTREDTIMARWNKLTFMIAVVAIIAMSASFVDTTTNQDGKGTQAKMAAVQLDDQDSVTPQSSTLMQAAVDAEPVHTAKYAEHIGTDDALKKTANVTKKKNARTLEKKKTAIAKTATKKANAGDAYKRKSYVLSA